jgi:hypothetical protein
MHAIMNWTYTGATQLEPLRVEELGSGGVFSMAPADLEAVVSSVDR